MVPTQYFQLVTFQRISQPGADVTVYIEGDGLAWLSRTRPSSNPTPANPLALKLASLDEARNVLYLARPCQFIEISRDSNCRTEYWTNERIAPEVLASMNAAISKVKAARGLRDIRLVGYSGGGSVATILAAQRDDVIDLRTLAGNLDIQAFTTHHDISPLTGSMNPVAFAEKLISVPQMHFVGLQDEVIPPRLFLRYKRALAVYDPDLHCLGLTELPGVSHDKGWETIWQEHMNAK